MRRNALIGALLLIAVGIALGATVFRTDIAQATGLAQAVTVDNTAANPVPVAVQGTASIQGTVSARPAPSPSAIQTSTSVSSLEPDGFFDLTLTRTTKLAVTSLTFASIGAGSPKVRVLAFQPTGQLCEGAGTDVGLLTAVSIPEGDTIHLAYPSPLIAPRSDITNSVWCLRARLLNPAPLGMFVDIGLVGYLTF